MAWTPEMRAHAQETRARKRAEAEAAKAEADAAPAMPSISAQPAAAIVPADEPEPELVEVEAMDPFGRFLAAQDAETRSLLSDIELRVIFEEETKRALDAKKEAQKKAAKARAAQHARADAGLIAAGDLDAIRLRERNQKKVWFTPELPQSGNSGGLIDIGLRIDGRILHHGVPVLVTRGEAESYRDICWRAMNAELDFEGRNRLSQLRQMATGALNMKGAPL